MDAVDVNNKCRACLTMDPLQLFDWNVDMLGNLTYMNCFRQCTQLEELVDEPTMLCHSCASELKFVYDFMQKTTESDRALRLKQGLIYTTDKLVVDELELEWATMTDEKNLNSPAKKNDESNDVDMLLNQNEVLAADSNSLPFDKGDTSKFKCNERLTESTSAKASKRVRRGRSINEPPPVQKSVPKKPVKVHLCHICSRIFKNSTALRGHILTHEEHRERNFTCDQCGQKFFTQHAYQGHAKTHNSNRQPKFQCDQCEKSFFHMGSLNVHKKQHTGNTLECQICEKRYFRSIDLEIHLRSHSGDTPYKCPICEKSFNQVCTLNKHVRLHEGYRYRCDICEKEYTNKSTLRHHRMEHTGLPLKCAMCGKGFGQKSLMRRHIGGVHKVEDIEEIDKLIIKVKTKREYRGRIVEVL